jgi:hypothetical protein
MYLLPLLGCHPVAVVQYTFTQNNNTQDDTLIQKTQYRRYKIIRIQQRFNFHFIHPRWCILSIINNLAIIVIHTTYIILLFTDFTTTCFDPYMIIFRSCHLILGILNHVLQLHILITLCMS